MKRLIHLCFLAVVMSLLLSMAGCSSKPVPQDTGESLVDTSLPVLSGEAARAADEITNALIYFAYDKFEIAPESKRVLARKAELMKRFPQIKVSIQGHCDERGTEEYNLALGERRAAAAHDFLVYSGVSPSQLEMISFGRLRPAVQGSGESVWAKNRRDEFVVLNPRSK